MSLSIALRFEFGGHNEKPGDKQVRKTVK